MMSCARMNRKLPLNFTAKLLGIYVYTCKRVCKRPVHVCVRLCMGCAHVFIIRCPLLPYIMPALPIIRHTARLPDRPLNPLPGTLTAPPWETDPEGPPKHFVLTEYTLSVAHTHTHKNTHHIGTDTQRTCVRTHVNRGAAKGPCSF